MKKQVTCFPDNMEGKYPLAHLQEGLARAKMNTTPKLKRKIMGQNNII
jgi:hypothetical protein